MKNAKYVIIAIACICLICGGFYFVSQGQKQEETQLTEAQKVILKDLESDYPKTPRAVVSYYNRIIECYYGGEQITEKELEGLVDQMICLFDEELALINPRDEYYKAVVTDIDLYAKQSKTIVNSSVSDSNDVLYIDDEKEGTDNADELAYVDSTYFVNTNGKFTYTYQQFVLRKDDDGKWKILVFYEIEGDSSEDE